jgi:hypothetical protein
MKNARLISTAAVILAGFVPATAALASNGADDAVQRSAPAAKVTTVARTADDGGRHQNRNRDRVSGRDDNGRHGAHHRRGARHVEAGDDNGGRRNRNNRVEAGDDRGARSGSDDNGGHGRGRGSDDL